MTSRILNKSPSEYLFRRDVIGAAAVLLTLVVIFMNWSREDAARAQELQDLGMQVQAMEHKAEISNNAVNARLDQLQGTLEEIQMSIHSKN